MSRLLPTLFCLCGAVRGQASCGETVTQMDLSVLTNPAVAMEWTNSNGVLYTGQPDATTGATLIDAQATDATAGAFPRGSLRFVNAVTGVGNDGTTLDLLITVSPSVTIYTSPERINASGLAAFQNPTTQFRQAILTREGYACLGTGIRPSVCASGADTDVCPALWIKLCTLRAHATLHSCLLSLWFRDRHNGRRTPPTARTTPRSQCTRSSTTSALSIRTRPQPSPRLATRTT